MHDENINVWGYMELLPKYLTEQSNFVAFSILFKLFVEVLFCVYILHKMWNQEVSCPMCGKAKKCTKKCDAYAELLLC